MPQTSRQLFTLIKMKTTILILSIVIYYLTSSAQETFTDPRDGKVYKTVKIGTQTWMAENLAYKPSTGNYWSYNNDQSNVSKYGYLYSWETAKAVCPAGWHLPSSAEWSTLTANLGNDDVEGGKFKSIIGWECPKPNKETNETGFSALPGGFCDGGSFYDISNSGRWWGSIEGSSRDALVQQEECHGRGSIMITKVGKRNGYSLRCIKD
jgi:uncharacterized protein (TIGR02145 family)